jgi:hypothetical protein
VFSAIPSICFTGPHPLNCLLTRVNGNVGIDGNTGFSNTLSVSGYRVHTAQSLPDAARVQPAPGDQLPGPIFIARLPLTMAA